MHQSYWFCFGPTSSSNQASNLSQILTSQKCTTIKVPSLSNFSETISYRATAGTLKMTDKVRALTVGHMFHAE